MHNGGLAEFHKFKRKLQQVLPDKIFEVPQGNTGECSYDHSFLDTDIGHIRLGMGICVIPFQSKYLLPYHVFLAQIV